MPGPTAMTCAGSWPEPEPWTIETLPFWAPPLRVIIWNSALKSSRSGLASAMPFMNSGTNLAGSLTNFFIGSVLSGGMKSGSGFGDSGNVRGARDAGGLAPVVQDRGDGDDARIGRVRAALADLAGAAAVGDEGARVVDRLLGGIGGIAQRGADLAAARGMLLERLVHRNQRVEQRLVPELGAAAGLDALDGRAEHVGQVLQRDRSLAAGQHRAFHEARAPDRARAAADVLRHQHRDLEQHRADVGLRNLVPLLVDDAEAGRQRGAEVAVAGEAVEVREVVLVPEHRRAGRLDRAFDLRLGNSRHPLLPWAAVAAASSPRSASLTLTGGSSPSSGTTLTAPVKSSSTV